jgi:hypothetical protein
MLAVEEWRLEQLLAAGDSRVFNHTLYREGCSTSGFSPPRGTAAQIGGIDKLFTADESCGGMEVIEQLLAAGDSRVFSRTLNSVQ